MTPEERAMVIANKPREVLDAMYLAEEIAAHIRSAEVETRRDQAERDAKIAEGEAKWRMTMDFGSTGENHAAHAGSKCACQHVARAIRAAAGLMG